MGKLKNLKISMKLLLAFGIMLIISTGISIYQLNNLRLSSGLSEDLYIGPYETIDNTMGIRRDILSVEKTTNELIINGLMGEGTIKNSEEKFREDYESIHNRLGVLKSSFGGDKSLIDNLENSIASLQEQTDIVYNLYINEDFEDASKYIFSSAYKDPYARCAQDAIKLYEASQERGRTFYNNITSTQSKAMINTVILIVFMIISGVIISLYISKFAKKIIDDIEVASKKISDGDFDIDINYESEDEFGKLSNSMREMSAKIKEVTSDTVRVLEEVSKGNFDAKVEVEYIGVFKNIESSIVKITNDLSETMLQISSASEEVEVASEQVASGAQMLSQGSTEQAGAIEELSSTISELSEKIKITASNAEEANNLTLSAGREVEEGNEQMRQMVKAMSEISFTSKEIGRIIKTIDDIAFQTNILALNAAVEAARAGAAGKGFAVVADEVRNLAAKSSEAAQNTAILIENSIKAVENGSNIVDNTAISLQKIVDTMYESIVLIQDIARDSDEQAKAIEQVTSGVDQISTVVQTNSATSEESAAASEELSGQAQMLKSLITNFNLKDSEKNYDEIDFSNSEEFTF